MSTPDMMHDAPDHVAARLIAAELERLDATGVISVRPAVSVGGERGKPGGLVVISDGARRTDYVDGAAAVEALRAAQQCADDYGTVSGLAGARRAIAVLLGRAP